MPQVLYDRQPLGLEQVCGGPACSLATLRSHVLAPFLLTRWGGAGRLAAPACQGMGGWVPADAPADAPDDRPPPQGPAPG